MEPLKPQTRAAIVKNNPEVTAADIQEYERLLSRRFRSDPDAPISAELEAGRAAEESRIAELYRKLFPQGHLRAEPGP